MRRGAAPAEGLPEGAKVFLRPGHTFAASSIPEEGWPYGFVVRSDSVYTELCLPDGTISEVATDHLTTSRPRPSQRSAATHRPEAIDPTFGEELTLDDL